MGMTSLKYVNILLEELRETTKGLTAVCVIQESS
jgi:hypothetical protein